MRPARCFARLFKPPKKSRFATRCGIARRAFILTRRNVSARSPTFRRRRASLPTRWKPQKRSPSRNGKTVLSALIAMAMANRGEMKPALQIVNRIDDEQVKSRTDARRRGRPGGSGRHGRGRRMGQEPRHSGSTGKCLAGHRAGNRQAAARDRLSASERRYGAILRVGTQVTSRNSRLSLRERTCFRGAKGDTTCPAASQRPLFNPTLGSAGARLSTRDRFGCTGSRTVKHEPLPGVD